MPREIKGWNASSCFTYRTSYCCIAPQKWKCTPNHETVDWNSEPATHATSFILATICRSFTLGQWISCIWKLQTLQTLQTPHGYTYEFPLATARCPQHAWCLQVKNACHACLFRVGKNACPKCMFRISHFLELEKTACTECTIRKSVFFVGWKKQQQITKLLTNSWTNCK